MIFVNAMKQLLNQVDYLATMLLERSYRVLLNLPNTCHY